MDVFERVVCGVDRSDAGEAAARLAARVARDTGTLRLVAVANSSIAVHAGWQMATVGELLVEEATEALERGRALASAIRPVETALVEGDPVSTLLAEVEREQATLVVVGSHGLRRATGIALGSVTTHLVHDAPCSVLVARPPAAPERWPRRIVVGVDGSDGSRAAVEAARDLAARFDGELRAVAALEGGNLDPVAARSIAPELEEEPARAVDVLSALSEHADLVVVGSRGLKGLRSLGSVSERVAHHAKSSVLVVRPGEEP
jgi:nucleotide-binding universal stress UspA family protein